MKNKHLHEPQLRPIIFAALVSAYLGMGSSATNTAHAQDAIGSFAQGDAAGDCTTIDLAYTTHTGVLTDEEINDLREARHRASLSQFERCTTQAVTQGGGGRDGSGTGGGSGTSVASTGVTGTQVPQLSDAPEEEADTLLEAEKADGPPPDETLASQANGRAPQDIPSADSDGALAAQIRRAAESETDPERRAKLWNEYRKIKGLPTQ